MLPTPELTWQHDVSQPAIGSTEELLHDDALLLIKNSLIGFASNPWTVEGSSDGVTAGMDAVDRWSNASDLVWAAGFNAGNPRSWIVLENAAGAQLLIELEYGSVGTAGRAAVIVFAPEGGYSGGTIGARPTTANGAVTLVNREAWMFPSITGVARIHVLHSTDGLHTRVFGTYLNVVKGAWIVSEVLEPTTNFDSPRVAYCTNNAATSLTQSGPIYANLHDAEQARAITDLAGTPLVVSFGTESAESDAVGQDVPINEISGLYEMYPIYPISGTLGFRGVIGRIPDLWFVNASLASGATFPLTPSPTREFIVFGDVAVVWNGSLPILT